MKKIILILLTILISTGAIYADKYTINRSELPQKAQEFLDEHFENRKIGMIKVDRHLKKKTDYDVKLVNGTKIEFSNSGIWTSVDCNERAVPSGIIPYKIRSYVSSNYSGNKIVKVSRDIKGIYTVKISNGKELKFNALMKYIEE